MKIFNRFSALFFAVAFASLLGCAATSTNEGTKAYISDSAVTTKVKTAMLRESSLKSTEIGVETYKGTVQLSGFVGSNAEIHKAGDVARGVEGVMSVKNDLRLK
ncbi:MAG TPA: BON domain-containing protein [Bradyrhizobium sp.]|jgi:osmotically-inducible protein OsmY|nr:BON domain-containing protein [Bradyrhizobium sp.]